MIEIPAQIRDEMVRHAKGALPNEACGFLAGLDGRVERFYPVRNEDQSPKTYVMDSQERLVAEQDIEGRGLRVLGIFHSHPRTEARPSLTDRSRAFWRDPVTGQSLPVYPDVSYVILSLRDEANPSVGSFLIGQDGVHEQEVRIV